MKMENSRSCSAVNLDYWCIVKNKSNLETLLERTGDGRSKWFSNVSTDSGRLQLLVFKSHSNPVGIEFWAVVWKMRSIRLRKREPPKIVYNRFGKIVFVYRSRHLNVTFIDKLIPYTPYVCVCVWLYFRSKFGGCHRRIRHARALNIHQI